VVENALADILETYSSKNIRNPNDFLREISSAVASDLLSSPAARKACPSVEFVRNYLFTMASFARGTGSEMAAAARYLLGERSGNKAVYDFKAFVLSSALSAVYEEAHA
jgi:predicted transcriptional regulator